MNWPNKDNKRVTPTVDLPADMAKLSTAVNSAKTSIDSALSEFFAKMQELNDQKNNLEAKCEGQESDIEAMEGRLDEAKNSVKAYELLARWASPLAKLFNLAYGAEEQISRNDLKKIVQDMINMAKNVKIKMLYHAPGQKYDQKKEGDTVEINAGNGDFAECVALGFEIGNEPKKYINEIINLSPKSKADGTRKDIPEQQAAKKSAENGEGADGPQSGYGVGDRGASAQPGAQGSSGANMGANGQPSQKMSGDPRQGAAGQQQSNLPPKLVELIYGPDFHFVDDDFMSTYCVFSEPARSKLIGLLQKSGLVSTIAEDFVRDIINKRIAGGKTYPAATGKINYVLYTRGQQLLLTYVLITQYGRGNEQTVVLANY